MASAHHQPYPCRVPSSALPAARPDKLDSAAEAGSLIAAAPPSGFGRREGARSAALPGTP